MEGYHCGYDDWYLCWHGKQIKGKYHISTLKMAYWFNIIESLRLIFNVNFSGVVIFLKDAGCEESLYPVQADKKKCWHFVAATRDYGFVEGAYDSLESSAQDIHIIEIALFSVTSLLLL